MKRISYPSRQEWPSLCERPQIELDFLEGSVKNVLNRVRTSGDAALRELTDRFDKVSLDKIHVTQQEIDRAIATIPSSLKTAILAASKNIEVFHAAQKRTVDKIETMPGVTCWRKATPIQKVGIYIPGGTAPLFSTVLMLAVPARIAGCEEVVLCSPPGKDGTIHPAILFAAHLTGVKKIYKVGGAQAIAAMAFGTETIPAVSKIFGPGNQYVTKAKQLISQEGNEVEVDDRPIWRAMAQGIESVLPDAFITYHPAGGSYSTSSFIHEEPWLDMNAFQSGHGSREADAWNWVIRDLELKPLKPTLDMEPCYEDHPVNPWDGKWTKARGYFNAYDVRARVYRTVFAGACGVTYGHHQIWQFLNAELNPPINIGDTLIGWQQAAKAEAAGQMKFLKQLMLSRPYFSRIGDQTLVAGNKGTDYKDLVVATRDEKGTYAFIYLPLNHPVSVDLKAITGNRKSITWFSPETGKSIKAKSITASGVISFTPPTMGKDWVLIIDDAAQGYQLP